MANKRVEAKDVIQENLFDNSIASAVKFEQALISISTQLSKILSDTQAMAGKTGTDTHSGVSRLPKLYGDAEAAARALAQSNAELERVQAKIRITLDGYSDSLVKAKQELNQLNTAIRAGRDVTEGGIGAYQRAVNQLHEVKRAMMDLAVANKLNSDEAKELIINYEHLNKTVRDAEMRVGQHQRSVGNYSKGQRAYNYEMFQFTQIMRELPNFAMSARIGIMALSNNMPMAADGFMKVAREINLATGKANGYKFAMKEVLKTVFSWQSLLLVGITIAVASADAIGKWASSVFNAKTSLETTNEALKNINAEIDKSSKLNIANTIEQKTRIELLVGVLRSETSTLGQKKKAQKELNEIAPEYLGNITTENANTQESIDKIDAYILALDKKAKAQALFSGLVKAYEKSSQISTLLQMGDTASDSDYEGILTPEQILSIKERADDEIMAKWRASTLTRDGSRAIWVAKNGVKTLMTDPDRFKSIAEQNALEAVLNDMKSKIDVKAKIIRGQINPNDLLKDNKKEKDPKKEPEQGHIELENNFQDWYAIQMKYIDETEKIASDREDIRHNEYLRVQRSDKEIEDETDRHHDELIRIKISKLEKERLLKIQKFGFDSSIAPIDSEIDKLRSELGVEKQSKDPKEKKAKLDTTLRDNVNAAIKLAQAFDQLLANNEKRRQSEIDRQIDQTKRRQDDLKALARLGSKDAQDSLALEEKRQAELEKKQDQLARRSQRRQMGIAALNSYSARVSRGDTNATANTISDISTLLGFLSALPGFYEGTENVEQALGKPHLKGKDGYLLRVDGKERIMNPSQNMMVGNMTNDQLAELAYTHRTGGNVSSKPYNDDVVNELREVKKAISSMPIIDTAWNEQEKAFQRTIKTGNNVRKELHKTGGIFRS